MQCKGTTKKGQRCRIQSKAEYCRHHLPRPARPTAGAPAPAPGYIYMYTLSSDKEALVYDEKSQKYKKLRHGFFARLFAPTQILVKVGYTTRTPRERMAQWEAQCKHQLKPVVPKRQRHAPRYDTGMNGWFTASAHQVEQRILAQLRAQFGYGRVECGACASGGKLAQHIEWFLLPRKQLKQLCKVVEDALALAPARY